MMRAWLGTQQIKKQIFICFTVLPNFHSFHRLFYALPEISKQIRSVSILQFKQRKHGDVLFTAFHLSLNQLSPIYIFLHPKLFSCKNGQNEKYPGYL
jgi:hypothetical protein